MLNNPVLDKLNPFALMPETVPVASVKLVTMRGEALETDKVPDKFAARFPMTFPLFVKRAEVAERNNNPELLVDKSSAPVCKMLLPVFKVNTPFCAKVERGVQAPIRIMPEVLLPMLTLVERIEFNLAVVRLKVPLAPARPMVVPLLPGWSNTCVAWSVLVPVPSPPICVPLNNILLPVIEIVPVLKIRELLPVVKVFAPAFIVIVPVPALIVVFPA